MDFNGQMMLNDFHDLGYQHMFNHGFQDSNDLMDDLGYPDDKTETSTYCTLQTRHSSAPEHKLGELGIQTQQLNSAPLKATQTSAWSQGSSEFWPQSPGRPGKFCEDLGRPGR